MTTHHPTPPNASPAATVGALRRARGFTLIELAVVVAIIGALVVVAVTQLDGWRDSAAASSAARNVMGAFSHARGEAIRTGNNHLVFVLTDISGTALVDDSGTSVPLLVLDDGRPGSANQNCQIDSGEPVQGFRIEQGVSFGVNQSTAKVSTDQGAIAFGGISTFADTGGGAANWVLFRPNGTPRAVNAACAEGPLGSGGGAIYLNNDSRDAAAVLTPLGGARVYTWNSGGSSWD